LVSEFGWIGYVLLMSGDVKGAEFDRVSVAGGQSTVNVYGDEQRHKPTIEERVELLERYMYDDSRSGEPGLLKSMRSQKWQGQLNSYLLAAILLIVLSQYWFR